MVIWVYVWKRLSNSSIDVLFFTARQYSVGFEVVTVSVVGDPGPHGFQRKSSGDYR